MVGGYQEVEVDFVADNPGLTLPLPPTAAHGLRLHDAVRLRLILFAKTLTARSNKLMRGSFTLFISRRWRQFVDLFDFDSVPAIALEHLALGFHHLANIGLQLFLAHVRHRRSDWQVRRPVRR
jgi:hypothetical protein